MITPLDIDYAKELKNVENSKTIIPADKLKEIIRYSYNHIDWEKLIPYLNNIFLSAAKEGMNYCDVPIGIIPEMHEHMVFEKLNSLGYKVNTDFKEIGKIRIYWEEEYND